MLDFLRAPISMALILVLAAYMAASFFIPVGVLNLFEDAYRVVVAAMIAVWLWPEFSSAMTDRIPDRTSRLIAAVYLLVTVLGAVSAWRIVGFWFYQQWTLSTWQFGAVVAVLIYAMTLVFTTKNGPSYEYRVSLGTMISIVIAIASYVALTGAIWVAYWLAGRT